ncbi:MAG: hypothetical protein C4538_04340 [Nitrospiraceae bacterium]|nr:MAG: hypothetical protein C4538_04340 [Nitrospiraceae bacterium]
MSRKTNTYQLNIRYLYHLFPKTPVGLACKYAGIPRPIGCT